MRKLSIITINYNNCDGLLKTIKSIVNQTWKDFEYIVIDGGSTDGSVEVIKEYADRINYWVSEPDKGIYNALNKGVAVATGEYCNFMNSGDCFCEDTTLEKVFAVNSLSDLICGNTLIPDYTKKAPSEITFQFLLNFAICHQCAFIRTTLMKKYGYDEKYKIVADRKFFVQALLLDNCKYEAIDVDVVSYDVTGFSAVNALASRVEYECVLSELIPMRILADYGRHFYGDLYGNSSEFDRLFIDIRERRYAKPIYTLVKVILQMLSVFIPSARFIRIYPWKI